jgi:hypothetical protein
MCEENREFSQWHAIVMGVVRGVTKADSRHKGSKPFDIEEFGKALEYLQNEGCSENIDTALRAIELSDYIRHRIKDESCWHEFSLIAAREGMRHECESVVADIRDNTIRCCRGHSVEDVLNTVLNRISNLPDMQEIE